MNERIRKLAEQAGATVITTHGMEYVVDGCYVIGPARLEKFAELIVRECEQVSLKNSHRDDDMGAIIARQIKQQFGVEE